MRRRLLAHLSISILTSYLVGCGGLDIFSKDSGGATETTNGIVFSMDGKPLANAKVALVANQDWHNRVKNRQSVILDSSISREDGTFFIKYPSENRGNLEITHPEYGYFKRAFLHAENSKTATDTIDTLTAEPISGISLNLTSASNTFHSLRLEGTTIEIPFSQMAFFDTIPVPKGRYALAKISQTNSIPNITFFGYQDFEGQKAFPLQNLIQPRPLVLLDDFSLPNQSFAKQITGSGSWYTFNDSDYHPNSEPSSGSMTLNVSEGAYKDKSLHAKFILKEGVIGIPAPYAGFGYFLGDPQKYYDLSKLSTISFMAKGKGNFTIHLESHILDTLDGQGSNHFQKLIPLSEQWTQISIPVSELTIPDKSPAGLANITWDKVSDKICRIEFVLSGWDIANDFNQPYELWLDEIFLDGIYYEYLK